MSSVYKGIWLPGETGFTGASYINEWIIVESKTLFHVPEWFPFWKYKSFGFQHHVKRGREFDINEVKKLMRFYNVTVSYYTLEEMEPLTETTLDNPNQVNVCPEAKKSEDTMRMVKAHNRAGDYIGDLKDAHFLMEKGIVNPIKRHSDHSVCSVGKSVFDEKWYGWSHRAISSFGIGSSVKEGDCAYKAKSQEDFMDECTRFWTDEDRINVHTELGTNEYEDGIVEQGCWTRWTYSDDVPNESLRGKVGSTFSPFPEKWGKGRWTAETDEDARQMAMDFADGVS